MRTLLIALLMTLATQVGAKEPDFAGSEAVDLVGKGEGLIISKKENHDSISIVLLLNGKYYFCFFEQNNAFCNNFSGYKK